jgi:3-oxoacyl-[acyl-carrier-protein] synthase III
MRFQNVIVIDIAHVDAPIRVPSEDFEHRLAPTFERLGIPPGMLKNVAGIDARRWWEKGTQPSDAATMAAEKVIQKSGLDRDRIGVVINSSVCRDYIEPSTACLVHGNLGLPGHCLNFDVGNACLAFMNAMDLGGMMIESGQIDYALIVDGESSRFVQENTLERLSKPDVDMAQFRAEFATLTLGSGGVAMLLGRAAEDQEKPHYRGSVQVAASQWNHLCRGQIDFMETDTRTLLAEGVKLALQTYEIAADIFDWTPDCLDHLVLHQVSSVHTRKLCGMLGLDADRAFLTFPEFGNIGPASVPYTLSTIVEKGMVSAGQRVGLMGIGSGLNCAMAEIQW